MVVAVVHSLRDMACRITLPHHHHRDHHHHHHRDNHHHHRDNHHHHPNHHSIESVEKAVQLIEDLFSKSGVPSDCFSPPPVEVPAAVPSAPTEQSSSAGVDSSDRQRTKVGDVWMDALPSRRPVVSTAC